MGFLQEAVVESAIWLLWALLTYVDVVLVVILGVLEQIRVKTSGNDVTRSPSSSTTTTTKPHVVIVGASFAGMAAHNELIHYDDDELNLTLIDYKSYFEYTPGVLRCFVQPSHYRDALTVSLSQISQKTKTRVITDEVVELVTVENKIFLKSGRQIDYDYLLIATGSSYHALEPIKATATQTMMHQRQDQWNQAHLNLDLARSVIIIGAGAVGVELAGEVVTEYPEKKVYLVDGATSILTGFPHSSIEYSTQWLKSRGVELLLGSLPKEIHKQSVIFSDGRSIEADLVYKCFGAAPCTDLLKDKKNSNIPKKVVVNQHLQLGSLSSNVFCAGDVCDIASAPNEVKLGHTAEVNAHLVARNIMACIRQGRHKTTKQPQQPLFVYPQDITGAPVVPFVYDISLGKYDGTLGFNSLVLSGPLAAILKWMIEWTKVAAASQRPVGVLFWFLADNITFILGRTVLLPSNGGGSSIDMMTQRKNQ